MTDARIQADSKCDATDSDLLSVAGGCHCGQVRFEINVARSVVVHQCNCSICEMTGFLHLIVPRHQFALTSGKAALTDYRFNTGVARHLFCRHCGVKSFYVPRSNPDGYSINVNCLELPADIEIKVENFDGRHWRANAAKLKHLTTGELS